LSDELDIPGSLAWEDGLPRPRWDAIRTWAETRCEPEERRDALAGVVRRWLAELAAALGGGYEIVESGCFLVMASMEDALASRLLSVAHRCRAFLRSILGGIADFDSFGKTAVLALKSRGECYRYVSLYDAEGEYGGSRGMHIRGGYPHVALHGRSMGELENTLLHELTHAGLHHLSMPQWLEEGLAQLAERDLAALSPWDRRQLQVDEEMALRHRRYWRERGLQAFWSGDGFSAPDRLQQLSYELAEILVRLLVEDSRPRWFGRARGPQRRFVAFVRAARASDGGEAASREHLGFSLGDLAARFLGPGPAVT